MSKDVKAIEDLPRENLGRIRHLYIVVRRGSDMLYEPDTERLMPTGINNGNIAATEELREALAEELLLKKMKLLDRGFKAVRSALNIPEPFPSKSWRFQQRPQSRYNLQDVELVIYPTLHLRNGSTVPVMDPSFVKKAADSFQHLPKHAQKIILLSLSYGPVTLPSSRGLRARPLCQSAGFDVFQLPSTPVTSDWVCYGKKGSDLKPRPMVTLRTRGSRG